MSVTFQGSLLPCIARKTSMIDRFNDVRKTFNDYQQESAITLNKITIDENHPWNNCLIKNINMSENALILTIARNGEKVVPNGNIQLLKDDEVLIGTTFTKTSLDVNLIETTIDKNHDWLNKKINQIVCPTNFLIVLIKRNDKYFVPNGTSEIMLDDTIVFYENC